MQKVYAEMDKFKARIDYLRSEGRKETVKKNLKTKVEFFQEETNY